MFQCFVVRKRVKYLFLDIASHQGCIACADDMSTVASVPCTSRIADHDLIALIEQVLKQAAWSYQDLTHIACVVGPGGFTSLRVAVTFTNVLADQLGIPAAGVHLSDLYGARVPHSQFLWLHSTKKQELFARSFGGGP